MDFNTGLIEMLHLKNYISTLKHFINVDKVKILIGLLLLILGFTLSD